jgi:uncharacterized protein with PIN domain
MAVPCRHCGRTYDVTLFEFGRTIWCTCGARVGLEPRVRALRPDDEKRFAADAMLGRLARWLRLLGFDCAWDEHVQDAELARAALEEGRIVLTRDRGLPEDWWIEDVYVVRAESPDEQLEEVVARFSLADSLRPLSRCGDCNAKPVPVAPDAIASRVPSGVLERHDAFSQCPGCGRVYWDGTHAARIRARAERLAAS